MGFLKGFVFFFLVHWEAASGFEAWSTKSQLAYAGYSGDEEGARLGVGRPVEGLGFASEIDWIVLGAGLQVNVLGSRSGEAGQR